MDNTDTRSDKHRKEKVFNWLRSQNNYFYGKFVVDEEIINDLSPVHDSDESTEFISVSQRLQMNNSNSSSSTDCSYNVEKIKNKVYVSSVKPTRKQLKRRQLPDLCNNYMRRKQKISKSVVNLRRFVSNLQDCINENDFSNYEFKEKNNNLSVENICDNKSELTVSHYLSPVNCSYENPPSELFSKSESDTEWSESKSIDLGNTFSKRRKINTKLKLRSIYSRSKNSLSKGKCLKNFDDVVSKDCIENDVKGLRPKKMFTFGKKNKCVFKASSLNEAKEIVKYKCKKDKIESMQRGGIQFKHDKKIHDQRSAQENEIQMNQYGDYIEVNNYLSPKKDANVVMESMYKPENSQTEKSNYIVEDSINKQENVFVIPQTSHNISPKSNNQLFVMDMSVNSDDNVCIVDKVEFYKSNCIKKNSVNHPDLSVQNGKNDVKLCKNNHHKSLLPEKDKNYDNSVLQRSKNCKLSNGVAVQRDINGNNVVFEMKEKVHVVPIVFSSSVNSQAAINTCVHMDEDNYLEINSSCSRDLIVQRGKNEVKVEQVNENESEKKNVIRCVNSSQEKDNTSLHSYNESEISINKKHRGKNNESCNCSLQRHNNYKENYGPVDIMLMDKINENDDPILQRHKNFNKSEKVNFQRDISKTIPELGGEINDNSIMKSVHVQEVTDSNRMQGEKYIEENQIVLMKDIINRNVTDKISQGTNQLKQNYFCVDQVTNLCGKENSNRNETGLNKIKDMKSHYNKTITSGNNKCKRVDNLKFLDKVASYYEEKCSLKNYFKTVKKSKISKNKINNSCHCLGFINKTQKKVRSERKKSSVLNKSVLLSPGWSKVKRCLKELNIHYKKTLKIELDQSFKKNIDNQSVIDKNNFDLSIIPSKMLIKSPKSLSMNDLYSSKNKNLKQLFNNLVTNNEFVGLNKRFVSVDNIDKLKLDCEKFDLNNMKKWSKLYDLNVKSKYNKSDQNQNIIISESEDDTDSCFIPSSQNFETIGSNFFNNRELMRNYAHDEMIQSLDIFQLTNELKNVMTSDDIFQSRNDSINEISPTIDNNCNNKIETVDNRNDGYCSSEDVVMSSQDVGRSNFCTYNSKQKNLRKVISINNGEKCNVSNTVNLDLHFQNKLIERNEPFSMKINIRNYDGSIEMKLLKCDKMFDSSDVKILNNNISLFM